MQTRLNNEIQSSIKSTTKGGIYKKFVKRPMDFTLALLAILVLSPVFLIIAILVRTKLGSPVLFKQQRPGLNEEIFMMYKFRTMTDERNDNGELLPDSVRLTKFGKLLRSTSLDEIPELINIIKGEMSFVGPRPQLVKDLVFMTENQRLRHNILPGLTGWAQINGRNIVTWEEKLAFDLEYINNITFIGDLKIIVLTIAKVFKQDGINTEGMETAEDLGDYLLREGKIDKAKYLLRLKESKVLLESQENRGL